MDFIPFINDFHLKENAEKINNATGIISMLSKLKKCITFPAKNAYRKNRLEIKIKPIKIIINSPSRYKFVYFVALYIIASYTEYNILFYNKRGIPNC